MKECELAKPVADWLRDRGYTVYSEVPSFGSPVDIVAINADKNVIAVELKLFLTKKVRHQIHTAGLFADEIWVAVASIPINRTREKCQKFGIGILSVKNGIVQVVSKPFQRYPPDKSLKQKHIEKLLTHLEPSDDAGKPNMKGEGAAIEVSKKVREYLSTHPNATWKEMYAAIPNHYCSAASMSSAIVNRFNISTRMRGKQ